VLTPLGLLLPRYFKAGSAWGEWDTGQVRALAGYLPQGLEKLSGLWNAALPDYTFRGWEEQGLSGSSLAYILAALIGIAVTVAVIYLLGKLLFRVKDRPFRRTGFIERSLVGTLAFFKESIFAEEYASRPGLLQSLDPRIKTLTILLLVVMALFIKSIPVLAGVYGLCLLLVGLSRIDLFFFLKRTWVFIPLFALFIAVPALFSLVTPGEALFSFKFVAWKLTITRQGLAGAALFVARVLVSVSFVVLLGLTTRHFTLLKVLRLFRIPQVFVTTTGMCYRYIYLLVEIIENTHTAIKSRVGTRLHYQKGQRLVAWNMAALWMRSYRLNEAVYQAMLSRGYRGEALVLDNFKCRTRDWFWLAGAALLCAALVYLTNFL
jgi:cobalt/nickel transport system permease protein